MLAQVERTSAGNTRAIQRSDPGFTEFSQVFSAATTAICRLRATTRDPLFGYSVFIRGDWLALGAPEMVGTRAVSSPIIES